ncbi:hypothetical protein [Aquitalea aquatilis]|uniref:hypothetical protein n=1 Tax=Aquitalea aquatilis TaxID=1537400 RepID=UPI0010BD22A4|nr:hypothetical protein [Aquitalea aquatilis]
MKNVFFFLVGILISGVACAAISLYAPSPIDMSTPRQAQEIPYQHRAAPDYQQQYQQQPIYRRDASLAF